MSDQLQGERRKLIARNEALMTSSWRSGENVRIYRISIVRTMSHLQTLVVAKEKDASNSESPEGKQEDSFVLNFRYGTYVSED